MKEVLVIYFSQSGQLSDILKNIVTSFEGGQVRVTYQQVQPVVPYTFPWKPQNFYDAFPETFHQVPISFIGPGPEVCEKNFDLVILGYQVWFLTPSPPINAFLKSEAAKTLLKDTPVVTVLACRNMWVMAQEKMKRLLLAVDAKLVGHIALVDRHINHISVITIAHWMFTGRKDRLWGIFPKPGVSAKDIEGAKKFGVPIKEALQKQSFDGLQPKLVQLGAVRVNPFLVMTDKRGNLLFSKWANQIVKKSAAGPKARARWVQFFKYYLLFAIWVIAPIVFIVFLITYLPTYRKTQREKIYFSGVVLK